MIPIKICLQVFRTSTTQSESKRSFQTRTIELELIWILIKCGYYYILSQMKNHRPKFSVQFETFNRL